MAENNEETEVKPCIKWTTQMDTNKAILSTLLVGRWFRKSKLQIMASRFDKTSFEFETFFRRCS